MSAFKDKGKRWRTKSLFRELYKSSDPTATPMFSLKCGNPEQCLHCLFLESGDPTGYRFAMDHLGGWKHYQLLSGLKWFKSHLEDWKDELEVKLRSEGIAKQRQLSAKGNQPAAKWLSDRGWSKRQAGAPSKAEVQRETKVQAKLAAELDADFERVTNIK
jgi:hypothetical protein